MRKKLLLLIIALVGSLSIFAQLSVEIQITQPTCQNSYASVTAIASGGVRPYTYNWSYGGIQDSIVYGMMPSMPFSVTVTDANSESVIKSGTIDEQPHIDIAFTDTIRPHCYGECNGSIKAIVTGGTEPYIYNWQYRSDLQGPTATGLCSGSIGLEIRDANGCLNSREISLEAPSKIELDSMLMIYPGCQLSNGQINVNIVSGGIPPFNFNWGNGYPQAPILSNIPAGNYSCTITDNSGCKAKINVPLSDNGASISTPPMLYNVGCYGESNGQIYISGAGGVSFLWENGSTEMMRYNLTAGDYYLTVTSVQSPGCISVGAYTITQPDSIHINYNKHNLNCNGYPDGYIQLAVNGGTLNENFIDYNYSWSSGSTDSYAYEILAGIYNITVSDANNCTATKSIEITEPEAISFNFSVKNTCFGINNDGAINFENADGGTPPYEYHVNSLCKTSNPIVGGLFAGPYYIFVTDAKECTSIQIDTTIGYNSEIEISEIELIQADCHINNGGVNIESVTGGTPNYTYEWTNGQTDLNLTTAGGGSHTLTITDAIGCTKLETFEVSQGSLPSIEGNIFKLDGVSTFNLHELSIELYKLSNGEATRVDSITNDETDTWYQFYEIQPGDYIVKSSLANQSLYPKIIATYYGDTIKWEGAKIITVGCEDNPDTINIKMQEVPGFETGTGGTGNFTGAVYYGNGVASSKSMGEPVTGKTILAEQEPDNDPIAITESDVDGYSFPNVTVGVPFSLWLDIPGVPVVETHTNLVVSVGETISDLNFYIDTTSGNTGVYIEETTVRINNFENTDFSVEIFPNPFKENISISYNLKKESIVNIEIFDLLGKKITSLVNTTQKEGKYNFNINTAKYEMTQAVYFIKLNINKTTYLKRIINSK